MGRYSGRSLRSFQPLAAASCRDILGVTGFGNRDQGQNHVIPTAIAQARQAFRPDRHTSRSGAPGGAEMRRSEDFGTRYARADAALYAARKAGRKRIAIGMEA